MSNGLEQVLIPCWNLSLDGQEAYLCIPLANMFPNDNENERDDDQFSDDAYMEDVVVLEDKTDDIMEVLEDAINVVEDDPPKMIKPASKTAIEGLEKVKIDERLGAVSCSVCFEDVSMGIEARCLPCSHAYHAGCIVKWLKDSNTCPLCRYQMPVVDFDLNLPLPAIYSELDSKNMHC